MTIDNETLDRLLHHTDGALKVYLWVALHDGESIGQRELAKELNLTHQNVRSAIKWLVDKNMVSVLGNTVGNTVGNTPPNTPKTLLTISKTQCLGVEKSEGNTPPNTPPNTGGNTPKEENRKEENSPSALPLKEENIKEEKNNKKNVRTERRIPTKEEVRAYFRENNITSIDPDNFFDFYNAGGWMRGKTKIVRWTSCVSTWLRNQAKERQVGVVMQGTNDPNRFEGDETW